MANERALEALLNKAMAAHGSGRLSEAQNHYKVLLKSAPKHPVALHFLGLSYLQQGKSDRGIESIQKALAVQPDYIDAHFNLGIALQGLGHHQDAEAHYRKVIAANPDNAGAQNNLGAALQHHRRFEEAMAHFEKALALQPGFAPAHNNLGAVLKELGQHDRAVTSFNQAIALDPNNPETLCNLGSTLHELERYQEALGIYERATSLHPGFPDGHIGRGNSLGKLNRPAEALAAFDRALALRNDLAEAWLGKGTVLSGINRNDEAITAYDKALAMNPALAEAWVGCGNVLRSMSCEKEALDAYDKAAALKPTLAEAWIGRGSALNSLGRYDDAVASYDKALALRPQAENVEGYRLHAKMHNCDWASYDEDCARVRSALREQRPIGGPFVLLGIPSSPAEQLDCAKQHVGQTSPLSTEPVWRGERYSHERIRVAYFSADFQEHAIPRLVTGVFEHHDRTRFETIGISLAVDDQSVTRKRALGAFERVLDVRAKSDRDIAQAIRDLEIDILVDLNAHTRGGRPRILSMRPAPLQVNYLGYPGTMGAEYVDYIIADRVVIPADEQQHYSEKIVYLPHSYQANDALGRIPEGDANRCDVGLPDNSFVFCSFNNNFKITPDIFDVWMRLLDKIDGSVLWLLEGTSSAPTNLRNEASKRGIAPGRIVFAPRASLGKHLARHRLADLFLDTLPYNAHTTCSDALLMGLPVVTRMGSTFAGRVAASDLLALGLPELVTHSAEEYEALACKLASDGALLAAIKEKLQSNVKTEPLFDSARSARDIEAAYVMMRERHQRGEPPASFAVG